MKRNKKLAVTLALVMTLSMVLVSCGNKQPKTLEEYVNINQSEKDALSGLVSEDPNATVTIHENTMEIAYKVEDESFTADILDTALNSLGDTFTGIITDLETRTEIDGISILVKYLDASGNEITSKVFE